MKPILFNTDMVRAILDGRKNVTRRVVKPQPKRNAALLRTEFGEDAVYTFEDGTVTSPHYRPGDIMYVRETWAFDTGDLEDEIGTGVFVYKADGEESPASKWYPSIHMPKLAARIFLRVTDVRVERLQNVTEDDVVAEGAEELISYPHEHGVINPGGTLGDMCWNAGCCGENCGYVNKSYGELFGEIVWNSTLKSKDRAIYGWEANPWVWVIEFERISKEEAENEP